MNKYIIKSAIWALVTYLIWYQVDDFGDRLITEYPGLYTAFLIGFCVTMWNITCMVNAYNEERTSE